MATSAELFSPGYVFVDAVGNILIADFFNDRIREVVPSTGNIMTVAGNGTAGLGGDGGLATSAQLSGPTAAFVDAAGNIFIGDTDNHSVREVVTATGNIKTVAGNGNFGFSGDGGIATNAELAYPEGVFVDGAGDIFIADTDNNRIREVAATTGIISTVAGSGATGGDSGGYGGDGGPATSALLNSPAGVFVDSFGNIFVSDSFNNRIREVVAATGKIQTVAGNGTAGFAGDGGPATSAAELNAPTGVFVDNGGNIFIADSDNERIREVVAATGNIRTVAGNGTQNFSGDGGAATSATLAFPTGLFLDGAGNIFIGDTDNGRIREVVAATGNIQTVAGNGTFGFSGDGGPATSAEVHSPQGVWGSRLGNLVIADAGNNRIRNVTGLTTFPVASVSPASLNMHTGDAPQNITLSNTNGTAPLTISSITLTGSNPGDFSLGTGTTCPTTGGSLPAGASCIVSIALQSPILSDGSAVLMINDNAAGSPQPVSLSVVVVSVAIQAASTTVGVNATDQITATVSNAGTNTAVTWQVNGIAGGNSTVGTISSSGLYTAPATVPGAGTVTVTAISVADPTKSASVTITFGPPLSVQAASTVVNVTGTGVTDTVQITANVSAVTWQVNSITGGNSTIGTISSTGLYTAPATVPTGGTVTVTAVSVADPTKSASVTIKIANISVSQVSGSGTTTIGQGQSEVTTVSFTGIPIGLTLTTSCLVMPSGPASPMCLVSPPTLTGNGGVQSVQVTITGVGPSSSLSIPQLRDRQAPLFATLFLLPGLGCVFLGMGFSKSKARRRAPWGLSLLLLTVALLLSTGACTTIQIPRSPAPRVRPGATLR